MTKNRPVWRGTPRGCTPAPIIEAATACRLAGDWRGACRAAGFSVAPELAAMESVFAAELATFAPDLLRHYRHVWFGGETEFWWSDSALTNVSEATSRSDDSWLAHTVEWKRKRWALTVRPIGSESGPLLTVTAVDAKATRMALIPDWCWRADAVEARRLAYDSGRAQRYDRWLPPDGRTDPDRLHPLVHDVLHPGRVQQPVTTTWAWSPVRVRCGRTWHEIRFAGGRLEFADHTPEEIGRELAFGGLNGVMSGCAYVAYVWRTGRGYLPKQLKRYRAEFFGHAAYGHTDDVIAMLDAGFDITAIDGSGANLVHYLPRLDYRRLWPRVVTAGLPIDRKDRQLRTPLGRAYARHAEQLVEWLLDAGADADAVDFSGRRPKDWANRADGYWDDESGEPRFVGPVLPALPPIKRLYAR